MRSLCTQIPLLFKEGLGVVGVTTAVNDLRMDPVWVGTFSVLVLEESTERMRDAWPKLPAE